MERVSWKDKVINLDVLQRVDENRSIMDTIWRQNTAGLEMFLGMMVF